ncbi:MAG: hypothetical protein L0956_03215, partial [Candidatus Mariimomonas ferrooxydans]
MKRRTVVCILILTMLAISSSAYAMNPVAVSPGNAGSEAVINQACPTFSWSSMQGADAYRVEVFEAVTEDVQAYEDIEAMAEPVIRVEIAAPALSWTPSSEQCLSEGGSYVWYVQGTATENPEDLQGWSEGRGFAVDVSALSAGMEEAVEGTVNEYLSNEWTTTESYREVKEEIKTGALHEIKGSSTGTDSLISIMGNEGDAQ